MNIALLTLASLVIGAALGLVSSVFLADRNHKLALQMKLVDCFLKARDEIAAFAAHLAFMDVRGPVSSEALIEQRLQLADLYYRHYGFIPMEVFESLHLLYAAMSNHSGRLYKIEGDTLVPIRKLEESTFIDEVAIFRNVRLHATIALGSEDRQIRHRQAVKLHAQHVLNVVNDFASLEWAERRSRALGRHATARKPKLLAR